MTEKVSIKYFLNIIGRREMYRSVENMTRRSVDNETSGMRLDIILWRPSRVEIIRGKSALPFHPALRFESDRWIPHAMYEITARELAGSLRCTAKPAD